MKLWVILKSRFEKEKDEQWVKDRRKVCIECPYNTRNLSTVTFKQKLIDNISDFYTWLTKAENDDIGSCSICGCACFFSTRVSDINCSAKEEFGIDYWKSIYVPNSSGKKNGI